jgi:prepilin peptidase CpaA
MILALSLTAIALFGWAALSDVRTRRIPNRLSAALAGLGLARIALALVAGGGAAALAADLGMALAVFALGAMIFHFGLMGGGDVKLLAAGTLWLGAPALGTYLFATVLGGGLLAVLFVVWEFVSGRRADPKSRASLPYGVAIAAGGILATVAAW